MQHPLTIEQAVEWRPGLWAPATRAALEMAADRLVPGASCLEVGYGTGMMACYLAGRHGLVVTGYDVNPEARMKATENARRYGVEGRTDFRLCQRDETLSIAGEWDVVFMKSVLFHIREPATYEKWLRWVRSVLAPGGVFIAVENGRGANLVRLFRLHVARRNWARLCLFDSDRLADFCRTFDRVDAKYFGHVVSPFLSGSPSICTVARLVEDWLWPPSADNCFVAAVVARRYE